MCDYRMVDVGSTCPNCLTNTFAVVTITELPDGRIKESKDCPYCSHNFSIGHFPPADPATERERDERG